MKSEVDRDPWVGTLVRERAVHDLPVGHGNVARATHDRYRVGQSIGARLGGQRHDVGLADVGPGNHPDAIGGGAAIQLRHEVEAVAGLVEVRTIPVRGAILMPRHRGAQPGILDEDGLVEGCEVVAVDLGRHRQQLRVPIHAQAGVGELKRAEQ